MSVSCKVSCVVPPTWSTTPSPDASFSLSISSLRHPPLPPPPSMRHHRNSNQCAPLSHMRAATPRSPRSKPKSTHTSSSPSSGTPILPSYTRPTFGYSSGSTSRACWTRPTREPFFSLGTLWSACAGSRTGDCPSESDQTPGNRRGSHVPAGEDGCHDDDDGSFRLLPVGQVTPGVRRVGCTCILLFCCG